MSQLTAQDKRYLQDERLAADKAYAGWSYVALAMGAGIAATAWFAVGVVAAGGFALRFYNRRAECDRGLLDPAREDFAVQTRPRSRRFDTAALGDSPLERAIGPAGLELARSDAYLSAMVRADERALGASKANAREFEELRKAEAKRHARAFGTNESRVSDQLFTVATLTESLRGLPSEEDVAAWTDQHASLSFLEAIPEDSRGRLRKLSVPDGPVLESLGVLFQRVPEAVRQSPTVAVASQTTQAAKSSSSLSESWSASTGDHQGLN